MTNDTPSSNSPPYPFLIPFPFFQNFAVIYLVDITEVPDFTTMYELYDPCTIMFFFRQVCSS